MSAYEEKQAEEKELSQAINKVRKKRMKKNKRLPKHFIELPQNPDKEKHSEISNVITTFRTPARFLLISDPSRGKTFQCMQILANQRPFFDNLIISSPFEESKEWDCADPTDVITGIPPPEYFEEFEGRTAFVMEDFTANTKEDKQNLSKLFRFVSSHGGDSYGITIFLLFQEWFLVPLIARRTANVFVLWDCVDKASQGQIERRIGMPKGQLTELFKLCKDDKRNSICIDKTAGSKFPLRLNLYTSIKQVETEI